MQQNLDVLRGIGNLHQVENICHGNLSELNIVIVNGQEKITGMVKDVSKKNIVVHLVDIVNQELGGKKLTAKEVDIELTGYWPKFMPILHQDSQVKPLGYFTKMESSETNRFGLSFFFLDLEYEGQSIQSNFEERGWAQFLESTGDVYVDLVRDFYAQVLTVDANVEELTIQIQTPIGPICRSTFSRNATHLAQGGAHVAGDVNADEDAMDGRPPPRSLPTRRGRSSTYEVGQSSSSQVERPPWMNMLLEEITVRMDERFDKIKEEIHELRNERDT
ncbi:hypothetical protein CJ030_MR4G003023 [Morella rubra]|uniref:Uncharacterized protein n=1 Tax=Morella rubra TaxID=262757 RepID=A0A6A1VS76_9ROSI|nr:hypothetical protein CJ030_MR4G003023 [Morella rubra]